VERSPCARSTCSTPRRSFPSWSKPWRPARRGEIIIARNGKAAAKLVPLTAGAQAASVKLGLAKGLGRAPDDPFADDDQVAALVHGMRDSADAPDA
jgi:antitoxin (DNA-binding transcriptional repressor) of toxin-antitoxin stability system